MFSKNSYKLVFLLSLVCQAAVKNTLGYMSEFFLKVFLFKKGIIFVFSIFIFLNTSQVSAQDDGPIAYIGHGAFFDDQGQQVVPTFGFVDEAQKWYREYLTQRLNRDREKEFVELEQRFEDLRPDGQERLVVQQHMLAWLAHNTLTAEVDGRTLGKLNALKSVLNWHLPERDDLKLLRELKVFKINPNIVEALNQLTFNDNNMQVLKATTNQGQAYIDECELAGVPIPPPIGLLDVTGLTGWKSHGFIPTAEQFIVGTPAEVRTFQSFAPEGMCIALPRYSNSSLSTVILDGVICMGKVTSKVCIWDNQMSGVGFSFPTSTLVPIGVPDFGINLAGQYQAGGFELEGGDGGVCTDCHAGENSYIVHPNSMLTASLAMGDLGSAPLNLPMFANNRYDPIVAASWPQNQLSMSQALVPAACGGCHTAGGSGGRFPHLSSDLPGYCNQILAEALTDTMPPSSPGSQVANPDVLTFQAWCGTPPSAGSSNRGDPHLTTTNGIHYDFQSAGEFTALRNSASGFELQTRQSPVATTFTPGANAYTGLASCVSLNTAAALRVGKYQVSYQPVRDDRLGEVMELRINNKRVKLPASGINLGGGNTIAHAAAGGGIDVTVDDGTRVIITPNYWSSQGYWYLNIEVLNTPAREGTMGHVHSAHWLPLAPDGSSFGPAPVSLFDRHILLNHKFADAWRVTSSASLFDYVAGASTEDFTDRNWPPEPGKECKPEIPSGPPVEPISRREAEQICRVIKDKVVFEDCVFDAMIMGDDGVGEAYRQTIELRGGL